MTSLPLDPILVGTRTIDTVAKSALIRRNQHRSDAIRNSDAHGLPAITISALQAQFLAIQAREVEVILGAALEMQPKLAEQGRLFDMVFIDADWGEQWEYFDWAVKATRHRGCIYVDNVARQMREEIVEGRSSGSDSLVARIGKDERVTATMIQTVSSHKSEAEDMFDGFVLAIVNLQIICPQILMRLCLSGSYRITQADIRWIAC